MTEKRYIYASIGVGYEILDSWFGYTGDDEPTEREIEEYDYLVIGLAPNQDAAEGICRRLNDQQDEINHLSNFGLHVILDKKNKEIEQLKTQLSEQGTQIDFLKDENKHMRKLVNENEQLKQRITTQSVDREQLCKRIDEVRKENEQLKKQSNSIYEIVKEYVMSHHCISTMRMLKKIEKVMWND